MSVAGIIFRGEEVLLIKRQDVPVWVLPGGAIDPGETPEMAIVREMEEETGYKVSIIRKVAEYSPANRLTKFTHYYECAITSGTPILTDETSGIDFFPTTALPKKMPAPYPEWICDAKEQNPTLIKKRLDYINYFLLIKTLLQHPILIAKFLASRIAK
jgi:8-oxo-dGTP diphosphatase